MDNNNLRSLHKTLQKAGYNPPAYEQFARDMEDDNNLRGVYSTLKKEGYTPPAYDQFKNDMGFGGQAAAPSAPAQQRQAQPPTQQVVRQVQQQPAAAQPRSAGGGVFDAIKGASAKARQQAAAKVKSATVSPNTGTSRTTQTGSAAGAAQTSQPGQSVFGLARGAMAKVKQQAADAKRKKNEGSFLGRAVNKVEDAKEKGAQAEAEERMNRLPANMRAARKTMQEVKQGKHQDIDSAMQSYKEHYGEERIEDANRKLRVLEERKAARNAINEEGLAGDINRALNARAEELAEIDRKRQAGRSFGQLMIHGLANAEAGPSGGYNSEYLNDLSADPATRQLRAAKALMDDAKDIVNEADTAAKEGKYAQWLDSWSFLKGAGRGFMDKVGKVSTWDFGISDVLNGREIKNALDKFDKGKKLTKSEEMLLEALATKTAVDGYFGSELGRGYKAGGVTAEALPFMLEMAANPLSKAGGAAAKAFGKWVAKKYGVELGKGLVKQGMKRGAAAALRTGEVAARQAGNVAGATGMALTSGQGRVIADMQTRQQGEVAPVLNQETGRFEVGEYKKGEDGMTAYLDALVNTGIENYTEMMGVGVGKGFGKARTKLLNKMGLSKVNGWIDKIGSSGLARGLDDFLTKTQWHGPIGEYFEEVAGNVLNAALVGDMEFSTAKDKGVFNLDDNIDTFLGVALLGGVFSTIKTVGYVPSRRAAKRRLDFSDRMCQQQMGTDWDAISASLTDTDEQIQQVLSDVMKSTDYNQQQKQAVLNYAYALQNAKGVEVGAEKLKAEMTPEQVAEQDAEEQGYNTEDDAEMRTNKLRYDNAVEQLQQSGLDMSEVEAMAADGSIYRVLGTNTFDEAQTNAVKEWLMARASYNGMVQRVRDDIDTEIAASDAMIDSRVFRGAANPTADEEAEQAAAPAIIIPATLKERDEEGNDKQVYIVSGNVQMLDDGTMVDTENSDQNIVVVDAESGKVSMISINDILNVDEALDAEQVKEEARNDIVNVMSKQASDRIDGTLPFMPGDNYMMMYPDDGSIHNVQIAEDLGDGTVSVLLDDAQEPTVMSKEDIQGYTDNYRIDTLQAEDAVMLGAEDEEQAEDNTPDYALNDVVSLQTDEGTVRGQISNEANEDGLIEVYTEKPIGGKKINLFTREQLNNMLVDRQPAAQPVTQPAPESNAGLQADVADTFTETPAAVAENEMQPADIAAGAEEPQQPAEPMPMREVGTGKNAETEPDWLAVTPERGHDWLFGESGLDRADANEIVTNNLEAAQKAVEKASKLKPKKTTNPFTLQAERERIAGEQAAAQNALDYWKTVQSRQTALRNAELEQSRAEQAERDRIAHEQAVAAEEARQAEVLAQREEQAARGANAVGDVIREKWEQAPKVVGFDNEITLANGERITGKYVLVESGAVTPSHDANHEFVKNEGFPVDENGNTINDRDYERDKGAQEITRNMANNYDGRALQYVPVVTNDGVVLSGNGRTMAGELAAANNTDGAYIERLRKYGRQFGFAPEQVSAMQHPRVVFVPDEALPYNTETFAKFNAQEMKGQNKTEQAVKLGKVVDDATFHRVINSINEFDTLGDFYGNQGASVGAINELRDAGVINAMQYDEMFDGEKLSDAGKNMLENMLIGKAFESNPDAIRQLSKYPSLRQSVVAALAEISNNVGLGDEYSLESELAEAIKLAYEARNAGRKSGEMVSAFARQRKLFEFDNGDTVTDYNNLTILMLADVLNDKRVNQLKKTLALYNRKAAESAAGQMDIFSGSVKQKEDIIKEVLELLNYGTEQEIEQQLADATEQRKQEAGRGPGGENESVEQDGTAERSDSGSAGAERSGRSEKETPSLTHDEAISLIAEMEERAEFAPDIELTIENWDALFGEEGHVLTPIGEVKMGENQFTKLMRQGREGKLGMIKPTLENPDVIIEDASEAKDGDVAERKSSYIFVKAFKKADGSRYYYFTSITVSKDGKEVVVSSQEKSRNRLLRLMTEGKILWRTPKDATTASVEQQGLDYAQPSKTETATKGSGMTPQSIDMSPSGGKVSAKDSDMQAKGEKKKTWLLTMFEKKNSALDNTTDTGKTLSSNGNDTATPESTVVSVGKGSENSETGKEKTEKVAESKASTVIAEAEQDVNTEPTEAQKEAGNYKKGHVKIDGFDISIEQPKGSVRRGRDASGKEWEQEMQNTYGYIRGTEGVDGDHIDVFFSDDPSQGDVFVVDQVNKDGSFDEHKVMYGFPDIESARKAYLSNYEDGWQGLGAITPVSKEEFKKWIDSSHRKTKPFAEYKNVKVKGEQAGTMRQPTGQTVDGDIAHFHKETDSSGRTAIDEANYNADDLVAPLLVDGKKSHIGITQIVPDDINEPTYTRAYYDYAHLIDPKTNKGWQAVGDKIDEWNASHKKDEQGFDDGDAPQVRFPSVDAALKFAEWFEASTSHQEQRGAELIRGKKWDSTKAPDKNKRGKRADRYDVSYRIGTGRTVYGMTKAESGTLHYLLEDYNDDMAAIWNAYERDGILISEGVAAALKAMLEYEQKHGKSSSGVTSKTWRQRVAGEAGAVSEREAAMRDGLVDLLRNAGVEVITDEAEGQRVLEAALRAEELLDEMKRKSAQETALPEGETSFKGTVISSADGAKVIQNLETLIKNAEKLDAAGQRNFLGEVAKALGARRYGSGSQYATFEAVNGEVVTIRLADHNAHVSGFDNAGRDNGISIVISRKPNNGVLDDGDAHVVEFFYKDKDLRKADGSPYAAIVRSIEQALYSGEYKDTTGLAQREEVNGRVQMQRSQGESELSGISDADLDKEYLTALDVVEKPSRIEKLRNSAPVNITKADYDGKYALNASDAQSWIKDNLRGEHTIKDTGEKILISKVGAEEVTSHSRYDDAHLKSISSIPRMLEDAIFIEEQASTKPSSKFDSFRYYVVGLTIDGVDYTAKIVIGVKQGKKYYDHRLTQMEKTKLIDFVNQPASGFTTAGNASLPPYTGSKDSKLVSLLQTKAEEIAEAEAKMRDILDEMKRRRGYSDDSSYQGTSAFNGAAPARNAYFPTREERVSAFDNGEMDGDANLGDFMDAGLDLWDLGWQINDPRSYRVADEERREAIRNLREVVNGKKKTVTMYRSIPSSVKEESFRNGDWITPSRRYAEENAEIHGWGDEFRIIEQEVPVDDVWWDGNDIAEWGYDNSQGEVYKNTANNRKSDDLVTRDDEGNVILPSQRYDERKGDIRYFRTADGTAYGFVKDSKIYIDPKIATSETPIHEYSHLWSEALEQANPEAWAHLKGQLTKDQELVDFVRGLYPEIYDENELMHEVFSQFSGKRGKQRLEQLRDEEVNKTKGIAEKARIFNIFHKLAALLKGYWEMARDLFAGNNSRLKKMSAEDFADMALNDLLRGFNPKNKAKNVEEAGRTMHAVDVTAEMKESVMQGQPLFQKVEDSDKMPERKISEMTEREVSSYIIGIRPRHHLKTRGTTVVIHRENELQVYRRIIGDNLYKQVVDRFYNENIYGCYLPKIDYIFIFPQKQRTLKAVEGTWWHENIHVAWQYLDYADKEALGLAALEYLKVHNPYHYDMIINGPYTQDEYPEEATARFVQHLVANNGPGAFLRGEVIEDNEKVGKLAEILRTYYLYGAEETNTRFNQSGSNRGARGGSAVLRPSNGQNTSPDRRGSRENQEKDGGVGSYSGPGLISKDSGNGGVSERVRSYNTSDGGEVQFESAKQLSLFGETYNVPIKVYDTPEEVTHSDPAEQERRRNAKGWYDPSTGEVVIIVPNNNSVADVEATVLHEIVGHKGLRELFGKDFDTFLSNVFDNVDDETRRKIVERAMRNGWDFRKATEEYLASLAESTDFENEVNRSAWQKIKDFFMELLRKAGVRLSKPLTDADLRYILWRSYERMSEKGALGVAEDVVMRERLGIDNSSDEHLYRELDDMTDEEIKEHLHSIKTRHGLKSRSVIAVINNEGDLETLRGMIEDKIFNQVVENFNNPNIYGCAHPSAGVLYIFPHKQQTIEDVESTWWHESTHIAWHDIDMADKEECGLAVLEYLRKHDPYHYDMIVQGNYPESKWAEEATCRLVQHIIAEYGVDSFLTANMGGNNQKVAKLASVLQYYFNNGQEKTNDYIRRQRAGSAQGKSYGDGGSLRTGYGEASMGGYSRGASEESRTSDERLGYSDGRLENQYGVRDRAVARDAYERMVSSGRYQFQEAVQDSMLGLKRLYQSILGKDTRIEDVAGNENAYLAENRMSSVNAAEQHEYYIRYMKPLLEAISKIAGKNKAERERLSDYMMAKHGLERNLVLAERDAREAEAAGGDYNDAYASCRERDYAGLTALTGEADVSGAEAASQQIVDDYERAHDTTELWQRVNDATSATLEKIYRSGLLSRERYQQIQQMFDNYIPLQGWDETTSDEVYGYLTSKYGPLTGSPIKRAQGRSSKADDPIATIALMADTAIRQGNRNKMKQTFLNFALNHPSDLVSVSDLWLQYNAVSDEWEPVFADIESSDTAADVERKVEAFEARMEQLAENDPDNYKHGRDSANIPYKVVRGNLREHQVLVKRGGQTYVLTINGNPRAAQALNGLTNPDVEVTGFVGSFLRGVQTLNRNLSAFYTTRNPDFIVSNFFRDMLYSNCMTWVKESPRYALRFHWNFGRVNPLRLRGLLAKWEKGTLNDGSYIERNFKLFMLNGGETGYTNVRDIEGHKRTIIRELKRMNGNIGKAAWKLLGVQFDLLNRSAENCARFAAFLTSRELGRSIERSVYDAKEVSVNFNKKGAGDKMLNSVGQSKLGKFGSYVSGGGRLLYVFWNAGVQGTTNFMRQAKRHPFKFTAGAASMFVLGAVMPILAKAMGGDDDDDENAYYNLPEYVRRSNIIINAGDQWIAIPLPIEFRALYGLGELATGVVGGHERYSGSELAYNLGSQVSQIMPLDMLEGGGGWNPFIPSAAKPFVEAYWLNKNWTGLPIYKDTPWNKDDPEWTKAYKSANTYLVSGAQWLNEFSGGDEYKKGAIDINPAKIEYLLSGMFGGVFTTTDKLVKMGETAIGSRDFDWRNMLIANRVVKTGDERTANRKLTNEYYKYKDSYEETKRLLKKYGEKAESDEAYRSRLESLMQSDDYLIYEVFDNYQPLFDVLYDAKKGADENTVKTIENEERVLRREMIDLLHEIEDDKHPDYNQRVDAMLKREFSGGGMTQQKAGSVIAKRMGGKDTYGSPDTEYGEIYLQKRDYFDLAEDVLLQSEWKKAKDSGDTERASAIDKARKELTTIKKGKHTKSANIPGLGEGDDDKVMEQLRTRRREILKEFGITSQQTNR